MYTGRTINSKLIFKFSRDTLLFYLVYSGIICLLFYFLELPLGISFIPISLIGTAVAFYVGFKNNSSYSRLWDARRIWGGLVHASRAWGTYVTNHIHAGERLSPEALKELRQELLYRHLAYINAIRMQLRRKSIWGDTDTVAHQVVQKESSSQSFLADLEAMLSKFIPSSEANNYLTKRNPAAQILNAQSRRISELANKGIISDMVLRSFMVVIYDLYTNQGSCEGIKSFPFPRQYAYYSKVFVWIFILLLPFGLINEFAKLGPAFVWLTIPSFMLIAWIFNTMEVVGDTSENPFENAVNDVPMTTICRFIEVDLRDMLNEANVPGYLEPVDNILM
jgi:ion channel-forming bestrophin family protein